MTLQDLFGIELPVIQAPMAGAQGYALAAAVANAGGLGSLPAALLAPEVLDVELAALAAATSRPVNINFFCHEMPQPDVAREQAWRKLLTPYYREFGLDVDAIPTAPLRRPFSDDSLDLLERYRPAVVSFHFGLPAPRLLRRVRELGCRVISSATTLTEALWLAARGVDAVIAQGVEAGGHRGMFLVQDLDTQSATLELVRSCAERIPVPVIAAGGIADVADVRAARQAGAAGVQVGTAYLLCPEATTGAAYRAVLASGRVHQTDFTNLFTGRPARGIVNRIMRELSLLHPAAPQFPLAATAMAPLRAAAEMAGSGDFSPLWCGTRGAACRPVPAAGLTHDLAGGK